MMLEQLSNHESLRDLIVFLETHQKKTLSFGIGAWTHCQNHACIRPIKTFEDFTFYMMKEVCIWLHYDSFMSDYIPLGKVI